MVALKPKTIVLAGGGTLGPVTPLLGLAETWQAQDSDLEFVWIGTPHGPEKQVVEAAGLKFSAITSGKLPRYWSSEILLWPLKTVVGFIQARRILRTVKPRIIISAGAYVAVPVSLAGYFLGIPIILHQQDKRLGLANKFLWPLAKVRTTVWPRPGAVTIGNFVRQQIKQAQANRFIAMSGLTTDRPIIVVTGGGTGARALNLAVLEALPELLPLAQVVHITGLGKAIPKQLPGYWQRPLVIAEWGDMLAAATIIVTRAGLGIMTEAASLKKTLLVIPIPHSQQEDNAAELVSRQAAQVLAEPTAAELVEAVRRLLLNENLRHDLAASLHESIPDGSQLFINQVRSLLHD